VKLCVASGVTPLAARRTTGNDPAVPGVQEITPVDAAMVMPATVLSRENVGGGSPVASTS
jgi:hypothetical protein